MKRPWTADLKVVTPPRGNPKPVTVIYPYYCNPIWLTKQLVHLGMQDSELRKYLSLIVVDDGSPEDSTGISVAERMQSGSGRGRFKSAKMFRIEVDVRWNWLAARNIGFHHADDGWCVVTDMDHVLNTDALETLIYGELNPGTIYGFERLDCHEDKTATQIGSHPNSWAMTREMFWKVGGYDETMSGYYGSDGDWRRRLAATAPMEILSCPLLRYEYRLDSSTTAYLRKQPMDREISRIVKARKPGWKPKVLSFPYHEVQL